MRNRSMESVRRGVRGGLWWAVIGLVAVTASACGADSGNSGTGGWGDWGNTSGAAATSDTGAGGDASADTWSGGADAAMSDTGGGWGGWGEADTTGSDISMAGDSADASADAGGGDDPSVRWQQKTPAPPITSVNLGGGETLELVDMRVTMKVEGLRARVLIDHIFYNPHPETVEGSFRYVLPGDASISYFAMFPGLTGKEPAFFGDGAGVDTDAAVKLVQQAPSDVVQSIDSAAWGVPKIAKIKRNVQATQAYEGETEKQIDPALVEQVAPGTFMAKVFPLVGKGYQRILVAYEQTLPTLQAQVPGAAEGTIGRVHELTFPLPQGKVGNLSVLLHAKKAWIGAAASIGGVPGVQEESGAAGYLARWQAKGELNPDDPSFGNGKLAFRFAPLQGSDTADVLAGTDPVLGKNVALVRVRPELPEAAKTAVGSAAHAVFLIDTSRSAHPARFDVSMQLAEAILQASPALKGFAVVAYDVGASWIGAGSKPGELAGPQGWISNDEAGRAALKAAFDGVLLEGGSDLGAALRTLAKPPAALAPTSADDATIDVFVLGDASLTWGDRQDGAVLARWQSESPWKARFFGYRLGIGPENTALLNQLAGAGGAVFECLNGASLPTCAKAHQSAGMRLTAAKVVAAAEGGAQIDDVLLAGGFGTLYPGGSVTLAGPLSGSGAAKVVLEGVLPDGKAATLEVPVSLVPGGELAPRAWGEIAVAQLLAGGAPALEGLALALAQHYRIANAISSFLLLEDDAAWQKYDFGAENTKLSGQTMAVAIAAATKLGAQAFSTWSRLVGVLTEHGKSFGLPKVAEAGWLAQLVTVGKSSLELALPALPWAGRPAADVTVAYADALKSEDFGLIAPFTTEAEARLASADVPGAVRAISTLLERAPADDELARLIGYRIAGWGEGTIASELLFAVLLRRPFEPQSWRDFAGSVAETRPALAILGYEIALQGSWPAKFKGMAEVVRQEYAEFALGLLENEPDHPLAGLLKSRIATHELTLPDAAMRVTVTWNTNATDIDLHVKAPTGETANYKHKKLQNGLGELYADLTGGYGPERFVAYQQLSGKWTIWLHYYGATSNKLVAETWAQVRIWRKDGKVPVVTQYQVMLSKPGQTKIVAEIEVP